MARPLPNPVRLWLEPGTRLVCPQCGTAIAKLVEPLRLGQLIRAEAFEMLQPGHGPNLPMQCRDCGAPFKDAMTGSLYTDAGWEPPLPEPEPFRG